MDDDVFESLLLPFGGYVLGQLVVTLGSGDVGLLGEEAVLAAFFIGRRDGFEFVLNLDLVSGRYRTEAEDGLGCSWNRKE